MSMKVNIHSHRQAIAMLKWIFMCACILSCVGAIRRLDNSFEYQKINPKKVSESVSFHDLVGVFCML